MNNPQDDLRSQFLEGMSKVACTVTVVTTDGSAGRSGMTVSAMSSVSADGEAPCLLVCVHHEAPAAPLILANGCFCTNVLSTEQSEISNVFAGLSEVDNGDRFGCASWHSMRTGSPRLEHALAAFDCRVLSAERVGTHHIFIGTVQDVYVSDASSPLLYANRDYACLA
ncbi:MAG: flavin reductase family protein [Granulosicoccaceae bacterium]